MRVLPILQQLFKRCGVAAVVGSDHNAIQKPVFVRGEVLCLRLMHRRKAHCGLVACEQYNSSKCDYYLHGGIPSIQAAAWETLKHIFSLGIDPTWPDRYLVLLICVHRCDSVNKMS